MNDAATRPFRGPRAYTTFIGIGLLAGLLSGLFGVGGGTVIVPLLVLFLHFDQRLAAGTSLAAIVPTAAVGVISYAASGSVAWIPALILAAGAVVGAQIGTRLLPRISQTALRWGFVGFLLVVIVSLFLVIPSRDAPFDLTWISGIALVVVGVGTGVLAGLIGVGGGVIVVPVLMLAFGTSDLVAKGTSLLMMIPTAVSGTFGNLRNRNVDLLAAALIGVAACTTTALGAWLATLIDPGTGNILFAAYLVVIAVQMAIKAIRGRKKKD
ncbi:sulfite exporter TauE/SafE family protein [Microbacterium sp. NPDC087868]|uniref:sulfite exporter TauE/SafE family protein n=1 Tax=Microbacterium sp. NPDC087868 TaxID=3364195 RepID=UPI00384AC47D